MPNRMLRESIRFSPTLATVSHGAERTFVRLIVCADDHGRFLADTRVVRAQAYPLVDRIRDSDLIRWLQELARVDAIRLYQVGPRRYGFFPSWDQHQRVRAKTSKFPPPPAPESNGQATSPGGHLLTVADIGGQPLTNAPGVGDGVGDGDGVESRVTPGAGGRLPPVAATRGQVAFTINDQLLSALDRAPILGKVLKLRDPRWWQAEVRANPHVDFATELLKAEAWLTTTTPHRQYRKLERFLHGWFGRVER